MMLIHEGLVGQWLGVDWLKTTNMIGMGRVRPCRVLVSMQALDGREGEQKNEVLLAHVIESVDSLARIAHAPENRITGLEDGR